MKKILLFLLFTIASYNAMAATCEVHYKHGDSLASSSSYMFLTNGNPSIDNTITLYLAGKAVGSVPNLSSNNDKVPTANQSITYNGMVYSVGPESEVYCNNGKNCSSNIYVMYYCYVPAGPTFVQTVTQTQLSACPVTQPSGSIVQSRTYDLYSDGSTKNATSWVTTSNTCTAVYQSTQTLTQTLACTVPYDQGGNGITQTSTRQIWTDGTYHNQTPWSTITNTCYKTVSDVKDNSKKTCAEGQTGYRITEWRRTHKEYSADSGKTPAEIAILNEQNSTVWTEVEVANTCVNVADKVTTEPGTRLLTCAAIYGGQTSDYTGEVVESGTTVYTYSSVTKQTSTTFQSNIPPTYNSTCQSAINDVTTETSTKACPVGYTGIITSYRYVATDSKGVKTYPNGTDFIESSNTCISTDSSIDNSVLNTSVLKSRGLLANNTIKTSSLITNTDLDTFIKTLDKSTMDMSDTYKLHLIVDDLSTGKYNKANVVKTINSFKSATGQDPIITVPQSLDKYVGNGGITADNYKNKVIDSIVLNSSNQIIVTYSELTTGTTVGKVSSFTVDLLK